MSCNGWIFGVEFGRRKSNRLIVENCKKKERMILWLCFGLWIAQVLAYVVFDHQNVKYGRILTLVFFLLTYLIALPHFFYPPPLEPGGRDYCGLPILAMYMLFWGIGGGMTLIIHLVYVWSNRKKHLNPK
jgi:hypothetical protein